MTRDKHHDELRNPHEAMENAKALLLVVNHLNADTVYALEPLHLARKFHRF